MTLSAYPVEGAPGGIVTGAPVGARALPYGKSGTPLLSRQSFVCGS